MRLYSLLTSALLTFLPACAPAEGPVTGQSIYARYCATCHQSDGSGVSGAFPSLRDSPWVSDDEGRLIRLLLRGMKGPLERGPVVYNNAMPPHAFLTDEQVAGVLTFIRASFGHTAPAVTPSSVQAVRRAEDGTDLWHPKELESATGIPRQSDSG